MSNYYKVSLKWTGRKDEFITFWRTNCAGYCWYLEWAGEYEKEEDDWSTIHLHIDEVSALGEVITNGDGKWCVVRNNAKNRKALGINLDQLKQVS